MRRAVSHFNARMPDRREVEPFYTFYLRILFVQLHYI
jgi:hypothetical protein